MVEQFQLPKDLLDRYLTLQLKANYLQLKPRRAKRLRRFSTPSFPLESGAREDSCGYRACPVLLLPGWMSSTYRRS